MPTCAYDQVKTALGAALPTSTTVEVRRLVHPDFLIEIEALAMTD
jgi:enamine deaminase RidA (YjgF/YER057c/UK114 family)